MLKIFGSDLSTPSNKVRFVANDLKLEYEYILVHLQKKEQRDPAFLKMSPAGKVPAIDDNGFYLSESNAIIKYLARREASSLYPGELRLMAVVDQWIDFISIHIHGAMGRVLFNTIFYRYTRDEIDERSLADGLKFLKRYLPVVENKLSESDCVVGNDRTLADHALLAALDPCEAVQVSLDSYPNITRWRKRQKAERYYQDCYSSYEDRLHEAFSKA